MMTLMTRFNCILLFACLYFTHSAASQSECETANSINQGLTNEDQGNCKENIHSKRQAQEIDICTAMCGSGLPPTLPDGPEIMQKCRDECEAHKNDTHICGCPFDYIPVCGTDDVTYDSECVINCMIKFHKHDLKLKNSGECTPE
ncbi:hypothetical protein O0L34_g107 [Tuta absoluta]|nr:hypothetical protein O0L34_g107 [Tuta absoluta]